jgi:hypothetical protein
MAASTKRQRGNATDSCSFVETECGLDKEDPSPSPVTSGAVIGSDPVEEGGKEEATTESGQMAATSRTNQRGEATGSCKEDSIPSLVTSSVLRGSYPDQDVVKKEATPDPIPSEIPSGWTRAKLEPDC